MVRTDIDFSNGKVVRKIEIWHSYYSSSYDMFGLRLLDENNNKMLSVGQLSGTKKEILLEANERILGIKSAS